MSDRQIHRQRDNYHLRCTCGYQATSPNDLDDHIREMTQQRGDNDE